MTKPRRLEIHKTNPKPCRATLATALQSRRDFLAAVIAAPVVITNLRMAATSASSDIRIKSPNGQVQFLMLPDRAQFRYRITLNNRPAIDTSELGIIIDGVNLGQEASAGKIERYAVNEIYPSRGVHTDAINHCNGAKISVTHLPTKTNHIVEVRAFNDGVAFRYVVSGNGRRVPDEASTFAVPAGSVVWFHDFEGHYEGTYSRKELAEVKAGEWAAPPLTIKLPNDQGYASITEGALFNYAGMGLQADGRGGFKAVLGHALPVSHPFDLRYGKEEAKRLAQAAAIEGTITTPWRVVMIGTDLNSLVNCDIVNSVSPPPDRAIFPNGLQTDWIKPGRAVWKYLDGGESTFEGMKEFSRLAGRLGFEYNVVEGFWQKWTEDQIRELVEYSRQQEVGLWFWKHSRDLRSAEAREKFFSQLQRVGVVGAKIDFFDHEAKEIIDLYQALLRNSAEHRVMVEFHGANKPAGESRTWPNEMTREAIRGLEYRSMQTRARHNTTLPFTRFLAGHADYTPMHFGERRRETSWAHQISSAAIFTSPVMIYGAHPKNILDNPAVDLIKNIPSVWDETRALKVSAIGELAAFARLSGETWFLAVINGETAKTLKIPLSFLGNSKYAGMLVRDERDDPAAVKIENSRFTSADQVTIDLRVGGGFVGRFSRQK